MFLHLPDHRRSNSFPNGKPAVDEFFNLGYVREINYFVDCILEDREPKFGVDGAGGLACMRIVEAFYRSAAEGKAVKVNG